MVSTLKHTEQSTMVICDGSAESQDLPLYFPGGRIPGTDRLAVEAVRPCEGAPLPLPLLGQPRTGPSQLAEAEQWKAPGLFPDYAPPVCSVHMEVPLSSYGAASLPCT